MDDRLLKSRSYRGIISASFGLYFAHFRLFFKATWLRALVFSVFFAALAMLLAVELPAITATVMKEELVTKVGLSQDTANQYLLVVGGIVVLALCCLASWIWIAPKVLRKLNELHASEADNLPGKWRKVFRKLLRPRHWGQLFITLLVAGLLIGVVLGVCLLPSIILAYAHFISQEGFLNGDPTGMPGYVFPLSAVTFLLTGFVMVYLCMPILLTAYYLYGSIVAYEKEEKKIDL